MAVAEFNQVLFDSELVKIGHFHAHTAHPKFSNSGPIEKPVMAFPRTIVEIAHVKGPRFNTSEKLVTCYNRHQDYRRRAVDEKGDICDWFEFSQPLLLSAMARYHHRFSPDPDCPFPFAHLTSSKAGFVRQRLLLNGLHRSQQSGLSMDRAQVEEQALLLLGECLADEERPDRKALPGQRALVADVKDHLNISCCDNESIESLAARMNTSAYHLCRLFKRLAGQTIHQYKNELRLRRGLLMVIDGEALSQVSLALGYSSHSHFSTACKAYFGLTPKQLRSLALR